MQQNTFLQKGIDRLFCVNVELELLKQLPEILLDLSAIPVLKELTHLPIIVDPSHAVGQRDKVIPLAKAAKAVGADGIMVEIHPRS